MEFVKNNFFLQNFRLFDIINYHIISFNNAILYKKSTLCLNKINFILIKSTIHQLHISKTYSQFF